MNQCELTRSPFPQAAQSQLSPPPPGESLWLWFAGARIRESVCRSTHPKAAYTCCN